MSGGHNMNFIIQMAREAGWTGIYSQWLSPTGREYLTFPVTIEQIERFFQLATAWEREAIAQSLDKQADLTVDALDRQWALEMAAAVRARSNK